MKNKVNASQQGSIIVSILVVTLFLQTLIFALLVLSNSNLSRARSRIFLLQSQYSAESGADAAIAEFNNGNESYAGTTSDVQVMTNASLYRSTYSVSVGAGSTPKEKILTATGKVYVPASATTPSLVRTIEVVAQRSSTATTSSIVSRNVLVADSGVKNIIGTDVYINGYIEMNKNTTNLVAESIFVADKKTGASNCSIGGTGNLVKPATFTDPAQTKTNITTAYNNCISPPGNTSNVNFTVSANTAVGKVQSTFLPWTQYMDGSYTNSPGGCNDWTTGSFPRDIPSTGSTKKTHYPDSGSGISASCGSSGVLNLSAGQYNIKDHVHVRANLCSTSGCTITLNNPDASMKFIFVEGTVRLNNLVSAAGSGPIAIVTYGADPAALASVCPFGGSLYLGTSGSLKTDAPDVYLLSNNGLCLDKTKFGSAFSLGGLSGKNIYIATNPGTPHDLALDPTFPTEQIPVDLAWRATYYRRK